MQSLKDKLAKLINVKTLVTFGLLLCFVFLAIRGDIEAKEVVTLFTIVISFYFGTQAKKE